MSPQRTRLALVIPVLAAATAFADVASAQVPPGHAIVATGSSYPGTPGLFLFPLNGGPTTQGTPITGLPPELSTVSPTGQLGSWAVSLRSSDGAILVTTFTDVNSVIAPGDTKLFVLHMNGTAVSSYQEILLGSSVANSAMNHAQLSDGRVFVTGIEGAGSPVTGGPMAGFYSAIVDLSGPAPTIATLPNPTFPAGHYISGGVAIDPTGRFVYLLQNASYYGIPGGGWSLLRQDLTPPYAGCLIASHATESAHGICCDDDGTIYVGALERVPLEVRFHTIQPDGCNPATDSYMVAIAPANSGAVWGMDLDRASGQWVAATVRDYPQMGDLVLTDPVTGVVSVIGVAPPGGWGLIGNQGLAVNNPIHSYGPRSDVTNRHWFDNFPNPGGQPSVGNTGFTLTMASAPGVANASAISLSFGRGSFPLLGAEILVDLTTVVTTFVGSGLSVAYPLPLPNDPGLAGLRLTAQSLHLEAGFTLAASRGLEFTIEL